MSADSNSFGSIPNSPLLKRLSPPASPWLVPLSYFLSNSRTGRNEGSSDEKLDHRWYRRELSPPRQVLSHRRDRVAERLELVGIDQLVGVQIEPVKGGRRPRPARPWSTCRRLFLSSRLNRASLRSAATRPIWTRNGPRAGRRTSASSSKRNLAILRVRVEVGSGKGRRPAGRGTHHHRQRAAVGLILGQDAVFIAVEVSMDGFHRVEPRRPEWPCPRHPTADG